MVAMGIRDWQKNLLLVFASCVATLVAAEIVLRLLWHPEQEHTVIRADPVYGWSLLPGGRLHSVASDRGLDYQIEVNSRGRRDRERTMAPAPGTRRILFLGDSFVFGAGVEAADRCTDRLERALGPGVEVVNAGVSGWGTDQEFLYLCREGFALHPDVVVLGFCMLNDVLNDMLPHELFGSAPKPRFELVEGRLHLLAGAPRPPATQGQHLGALLKHSRLVHFVGRHLRLLRLRAPPLVVTPENAPYYPEDFEADSSHWSVFKRDYSPRFEAAFRVTEALVVAMDDSCAARGIAFVVAAFPQKVEVDSLARDRELQHYGYDPRQFDLAGPYARLRALVEARGVPLVYPLAEARRAAARAPLFFARDGHPDAAGHAVMATALLPVLREELAGRHSAARAAGEGVPVRAGRAP
jgi:lysophospholipase L1-like esterase